MLHKSNDFGEETGSGKTSALVSLMLKKKEITEKGKYITFDNEGGLIHHFYMSLK